MTRKVFVAGQILTAAELNVVSDQTVMSFGGTAARGSAIPSPVEGMTTYLEDSNSVQIYDGSAWKRVLNTTGSVLQVVSTTKTDTFSTTSTSFVDVTGYSASITPTATSSKILVMIDYAGGGESGVVALQGLLLRDATEIYRGDAAGNRTRALNSSEVDAPMTLRTAAIFLDSPNTTSATTYKMQIRSNNGVSVSINRSPSDLDTAQRVRAASSITLMEIAG